MPIQLGIKKIELDKAKIDSMSRDELKDLFMYCSMLNDLNILDKQLIIYMNNSRSRDADNLRVIGLFNLKIWTVIILVSKIVEMWKYIKKRHNPHADRKINIWFNKLNKYFNNGKSFQIFSTIRNKLSFHYDTWDDFNDQFAESIKKLDNYIVYTLDDSGNDLYYWLIESKLNVIFKIMEEKGMGKDKDELLGKLMKLTIKGTKLCQRYCHTYIRRSIRNEKIDIEDKGQEMMNIYYDTEMNVDFFMKTNTRKENGESG